MLPNGEDGLLPFRAINTSAAFISSKVSGQGRREGEGRPEKGQAGRLMLEEGIC